MGERGYAFSPRVCRIVYVGFGLERGMVVFCQGMGGGGGEWVLQMDVEEGRNVCGVVDCDCRLLGSVYWGSEETLGWFYYAEGLGWGG